MSMNDLPWSDAPPPDRRGRETAAAVLRALGAALERQALRLLRTEATAERAEPLLEFHAEAGAPEGAVYVNGQLVGHLTGVTRL